MPSLESSYSSHVQTAFFILRSDLEVSCLPGISAFTTPHHSSPEGSLEPTTLPALPSLLTPKVALSASLHCLEKIFYPLGHPSSYLIQIDSRTPNLEVFLQSTLYIQGQWSFLAPLTVTNFSLLDNPYRNRPVHPHLFP